MSSTILTLTNTNLTAELFLDLKEVHYREYMVVFKGVCTGDIKIKRKIGDNVAYQKVSPTNPSDFVINDSGAGYCLTNLARVGSIIFELSNPSANALIEIVVAL
jgi:hypothetical protein